MEFTYLFWNQMGTFMHVPFFWVARKISARNFIKKERPTMVITSMIIICTSIKNDGLNKLRNATASLNLFILQSKHHNQSEMLGRTDICNWGFAEGGADYPWKTSNSKALTDDLLKRRIFYFLRPTPFWVNYLDCKSCALFCFEKIF